MITTICIHLCGALTALLCSQVGVQAAGLDAIVRKLVGPQGMLTAILSGKKAIMDVFAPLLKPAMGGMADEMIAILKQVRNIIIIIILAGMAVV